jgi:Predicted hydrolases or acyltransferases (alpha/beta hydrolase superfamily)
MLHGGGPGASGMSNFKNNLPAFAEHFRTLVVDQPGYGKSDKPAVQGNYFTFAATALKDLLDELGIDQAHLVGNSLGGGTAVRFALEPRTRRPPRPDGTRRPVPQRVRPGPDRGRQAAGRVRRAAGPEPGEDGGVPPYPGLRPAAGHRRADRRALRPASDPGSLQAMASMGASFFDPPRTSRGCCGEKHTGSRHRVLLIWGREDRVNPVDGALVAMKMIRPGPAARVRRLRPLGAAGEGGRIQPAGDRVPERRHHMISSLGYLRIESADPNAWREFGVKILGMTEGRGPEADVVYLRMDEFPARLVIVPGSADRLLASGWEVADTQALATVGRALADAGVPYKAGTDDELAARRVGAMLKLEDPAGHALEVFCGAALDSRPSVSPYGNRFVTGDLGLGHVVLPVPAGDEAALGF